MLLPRLGARSVNNGLRGDRTLDGGNRGGVVVREIGDGRRFAALFRGNRAGIDFPAGLNPGANVGFLAGMGLLAGLWLLVDVGFKGVGRFGLGAFRSGPRLADRFLPDAFFSDSRGQALGQRRVRRLTGDAARNGRPGKTSRGNGALGVVLFGCRQSRLCLLGRTRGRRGRLGGRSSSPRRSRVARLGRRSRRRGRASRRAIGNRASGRTEALWPRPVLAPWSGAVFRRCGIVLARRGNVLAGRSNVLSSL